MRSFHFHDLIGTWSLNGIAASLLVAIIFHQLFEGLSLGIRIASLPSSEDGSDNYINILRSTLAVLFAVTNPVGIILGLVVFKRGLDVGTYTIINNISPF